MYTLITPPSGAIVTPQELKKHLRVDHDHEDEYISSLYEAAVASTEAFLRRKLLTQTWEASLEYFPSVICLPWPPVQSIVSIKYIDIAGQEQTLPESEYYSFLGDLSAEIEPREAWPTVGDAQYRAKVRFTCGYGTAQEVPSQAKLAIKMLVATWHQNRETVSNEELKEIPQNYTWLLMQIRNV